MFNAKREYDTVDRIDSTFGHTLFGAAGRFEPHRRVQGKRDLLASQFSHRSEVEAYLERSFIAPRADVDMGNAAKTVVADLCKRLAGFHLIALFHLDLLQVADHNHRSVIAFEDDH